MKKIETFAGDDGFNSTEEMLARLGYAAGLAAFAAGLVLVPVGLFTVRLDALGLGMILLAVTWRARHWLRKQSEVSAWSYPELGSASLDLTDEDEAVARHLLALIREWRRLEQRRGHPDFDPWASQSVRHDIKEVLEEDPALRRLFNL